MKNITLNNKKYNMPESWDDITVKDQIRIANIAQEYTGLTAQLQLIAGYANIPVDEIKHTHISKLPTLVKHLEFIQEPLKDEPIEEFEFKGEKYHVMQTLIDGEFQDFISLESAIKNNEEKSYEAVPMMIAILAKKQGESLDDYDIDERAKLFLDLPIKIANSISSFFLSFAMLSQSNTPTSLVEVEKKMNEEVLKRFEELKNTTIPLDGLGWFGRLRVKMLRRYTKSLEKNFRSSLTSTQSKSLKTS